MEACGFYLQRAQPALRTKKISYSFSISPRGPAWATGWAGASFSRASAKPQTRSHKARKLLGTSHYGGEPRTTVLDYLTPRRKK
jgi:hypothetical protein